MIIDKNGKLFGKINIIDIFVVVLIIIVGVFGANKFLGASKGGIITPVSKEKVELYFVNTEIIADYVEGKFSEGDIISDRNTNAVLGKITKIEIEPSHSYAYNSDGEYVMGPRPEYCSVKVTAEGTGIFLEKGGITFDNTDYYFNRNLDVKIGNAVLPIRLSNFKKITE